MIAADESTTVAAAIRLMKTHSISQLPVLDHKGGHVFENTNNRFLCTKSARISRAALCPGAPVTPPPGCVPEPHM